MKKTEINICITAHNEGILIGLTLESILQAKKFARNIGIETIISICVDSGDHKTKDFVCKNEDKIDKLLFTDFKDQGLARNKLVNESKSEYLGFMDADDLCSENWIEASLRKILLSDQKVIVHPELNWFFDNQNSILLNIEDENTLFDKEYYLQHNYYDALCIAPRKVWLQTPYCKRQIKRGFAYEDWLWNIETHLAGWKHEIAKDTVIFKRRRKMNSQNLKASRSNNTINFSKWREFL